MSNHIVSHNTISYGQGHELLAKLEAAGLTPRLAQKMIESPNNQLAKEIVSFIRKQAAASCTAWDKAKIILGSHAIGIDDSVKLGLLMTYTAINYNQVPFSEDELETARDQGLYLVAMPAIELTVLERLAENYVYRQLWYQDESFAAETRTRPGYHLMYLDGLPNSEKKTWSEQVALQPEGFDVPRAVEVCYLLTVWAALQTIRLPRTDNIIWFRCLDKSSDLKRAAVRVATGRIEVTSFGDRAFRNVVIASGQYRPCPTY